MCKNEGSKLKGEKLSPEIWEMMLGPHSSVILHAPSLQVEFSQLVN